MALYFAELKICILAVGDNSFIEEEDFKEDLNDMLKCDIVSIPLRMQKGIDHCGSSAVMIVLEFRRLYHHAEKYLDVGWPYQLVCPIKLHHTIIKRFFLKPNDGRMEKCESITAPDQNIKKRFWIRCPKCPASWLGTSRQPLAAHSRTCKGTN